MASLYVNKVIECGKLTADPELKMTTSGLSVVSFTIAVNRKIAKKGEQKIADFIRCIAWRGTAEFISKYFHKGSSIFVIGSIQTRSWDDNGKKRYETEVVVEEAQFVDSKAASTAPAENPTATQPYAESPKDVVFEEMSSDDELPF